MPTTRTERTAMNTNDKTTAAEDADWIDVGTDDSTSTMLDDDWDFWSKDSIGRWHYAKA